MPEKTRIVDTPRIKSGVRGNDGIPDRLGLSRRHSDLPPFARVIPGRQL